jgi:flagellar basal body-associated protein FliL
VSDKLLAEERKKERKKERIIIIMIIIIIIIRNGANTISLQTWFGDLIMLKKTILK